MLRCPRAAPSPLARVQAASLALRRSRAGPQVHPQTGVAPRDGPRASLPCARAARCGKEGPRSPPGREPASPEALLQRGVDQRTCPCRALAGTVHHVVDDRAPFLTLDAALLDEGVYDLLHLVTSGRSGPYL